MHAEAPARRLNHFVWIGALLTFAAAVSYFLVFARWATLRDFPWINLPLVLAGFAISLLAFLRRKRGSVWAALISLAGLGFSTLIAGLFCFYIFVLSWSLPAASETTTGMELAPDFALADQSGEVVQLADLRGEKVVLVFFRGFW